MARVLGGWFLPYLFKEGVLFFHLHAHYSPSFAPPENHLRMGSDPIFGAKIKNGPFLMFCSISFYGGPWGISGFWENCRHRCPLWENKGGWSSDPLFSPENGFWQGAWCVSCSSGVEPLFPAFCASVVIWEWRERVERALFQMLSDICPISCSCPRPPGAQKWQMSCFIQPKMFNIILLVSWIYMLQRVL